MGQTGRVWRVPRWRWCGILAVVLLGRGEARADLVVDWIASLHSGDHKTRIEAIQKLGTVPEQRAADALTSLLDIQLTNAEEREQLWLHLAQALHRLAAVSLIDERVLPALERLSQTTPTVTYLDTENFRTPRRIPKYRFDYAAWRAANFIKAKMAERQMFPMLDIAPIGREDAGSRENSARRHSVLPSERPSEVE